MAVIRKRRLLPTVAVVAVVASTVSVSAFTTVDRRSLSSTFSSISRPQTIASKTFSTTKLYAQADDDKKLTIETVADDNYPLLLHPPSDPHRPVLVDAFAPWCGPCKLLDKVLRKSQPRYLQKVDFCRWNVNDKEGTVELKKLFLESGFTLTSLPSLIVFREGKAVAVRPGFANEFQLDDFLEKTLPDVLERTFDENGIKMLPLPENAMVKKEVEDKKEKAAAEEKVKAEKAAAEAEKDEVVLAEKAMEKELKETGRAEELIECNDPEECWERVETTLWQNRTVVPAMDGVMLPARIKVSP